MDQLVERYRVVLLVTAAAMLALSSHPFAPTWHDENYSLYWFVDRGPRSILFDYHMPNNHILYSLGQWFWRGLFGEDVLINRLLPLLSTALAIPGLYLAGSRIHGKLTGLIACSLFASSHIVGNYAAQLRGYGFSLGLLSLALGSAIAWWRDGFRGWRWSTVYVLACALSIGVIPTNAIFVMAFGAWLTIEAWRKQAYIVRVILIGVLPAAGLLFYVAVWEQLTIVARFGRWYDYPDFVKDLTRDMFVYDMPWAIPLAVYGFLKIEDRNLRLSVSILTLLSGFTILVPLAGNVPWPRNYVPLILVVALLSSVAFAEWVKFLGTSRFQKIQWLAFLILIAAVAGREAALAVSRDVRVSRMNGRPISMIDQYQYLPDYNKLDIETRLASAEPASILLLPSDVYWDLADALDRQGKVLGPAILCVFQRGNTTCGQRINHQGHISRIYVIDWDTARYRQVVDNFVSTLKLPRPPELTELTTTDQFKLWVGEIDVVLLMEKRGDAPGARHTDRKL